MDHIPEQTAGSLVPQITEEIVDRILDQTVGSPVPQITEEIVDRIPEQTAGSPVPQITEGNCGSYFAADCGFPRASDHGGHCGSVFWSSDCGFPPCLRSSEEIVDRILEQTVGLPRASESRKFWTVCRVQCATLLFSASGDIFEEVGSASVEADCRRACTARHRESSGGTVPVDC